jgi:hypothetical protein
MAEEKFEVGLRPCRARIMGIPRVPGVTLTLTPGFEISPFQGVSGVTARCIGTLYHLPSKQVPGGTWRAAFD